MKMQKQKYSGYPSYHCTQSSAVIINISALSIIHWEDAKKYHQNLSEDSQSLQRQIHLILFLRQNYVFVHYAQISMSEQQISSKSNGLAETLEIEK